MELVWWLGESSVSEAAGSLTLGMAWWAFRNNWRNQPRGEWDGMVGGRACSGDGNGRTWDDLADMAPIRQVTRGSPLNCSCLLLDRLCCCPRGPCSYGRTRHTATRGQVAYAATCFTALVVLAHTAARVIRPSTANSLIRPHASFGL